MFSSKERPEFAVPYPQTPYSRVNPRRIDPTVEKIISKPRTCENGYGRNCVPMKSFALRNLNANPYRSVQPFNDQSPCGFNEESYEVPGVPGYVETVRSRPEYVTGQFRPRKSQLEKITPPERNYDQSLSHVELEMMNIGESCKGSEVSKQRPQQPKFHAQETDSKGFQIKSRESLFRLFTGSVDNLLHWSRLRDTLHVIFEVTAILDDVQQGKWKSEKILILRDPRTGSSLQATYYEIDRPLPKVSLKSAVTCVGRLVARNRLHAFKVEESSQERMNDAARLAFICNRVAEEIFASSQKK